MEINEDIAAALSTVKAAFSDMGYILDTIKIKNGFISFDVIDGQYSLIFKYDEKANIKILTQTNQNKSYSFTKSSKENWYHKLSK